MNVQNLFPTPIGHFNNVEFTNKVLPIANSIFDKVNLLHPFGYQSTHNIDEVQNYLKSFTWIEDYIKEISQEFIKKIGFEFRKEIEIGALLVSKINNTQYHIRHTHPHAVLAGVMYLETTPDCAPLIFEDSRLVRDFNNMRPTKKGLITNLSTVRFDPKAGDIVLFETWVPHSVPKIEGEGYRKTLVFNIDYK